VVGSNAICALALLGGCSFAPGKVPGGTESDAAVDRDATPGCNPTWYDGAWHKRMPITVAHTMVGDDLPNFPVLVDVVLPGARSAAEDVLFTAADGLTPLEHEVESYEPGSGRLIAWVRVPLLSSAVDTTLYVYAANPNASGLQDPASVWSNNYTAVWHLREDPTGAAPQMKDSTGHGLDATSRGTMLVSDQMPGKIAGSMHFDGTNDGLDVPSTTIGTTFSYEVWMNKSAATNWHAFIDNWPGYNRWFGTTDSQMSFWDGGSNIVNSNVTLGTWYMMVATYDGSTVRIYRNGVMLTPTHAKSFQPVTSTMQIGYTNTSIWESFPGQLDEVRISSVQRSTGYIQTAYRNQNMPSQFYAVAAIESCP